MDDRTLVELAAEGDENLATTWSCVAASAGSDREDDGVAVRMASGLPIAYFNGAFCRRPVAPFDADAVLGAAIDFFGSTRSPLAVVGRGPAPMSRFRCLAWDGGQQRSPTGCRSPERRSPTWSSFSRSSPMDSGCRSRWRRRSCPNRAEHATLQSSPSGYPVYARMGFVDVGRYEQWEGPPAA